MTFSDLEREVKHLKGILEKAVAGTLVHESNCETLRSLNGICNCWRAEANLALNPPPEVQPKFAGVGARWEGEECGDKGCKHSSTYHSGGGKGLCCKVDCGCDKFIPTGRANEQAR